MIEWLKKLFGRKAEVMTNRVFDGAFDLLMLNEGGYVCDKDDAGGETKYGISKASYPNEDICSLTLDRAKEIYKRDFWDRCKCDQLPDCLSIAVFDFAVNSGVKTATKKLQKALGVKQDGVIGNETIGAANRLNPRQVLDNYINYRLEYIAEIIRKKPKQKKFERGWSNRINRVKHYCETLI
jgi:lysozyme family protein